MIKKLLKHRTCPLCGGTGGKTGFRKHFIGRHMVAVKYVCICIISKQMSLYHPLLKHIENYLPAEEIDKRLILYLKDRRNSPNYLIRFTPLDTFLMQIKSKLMYYRFHDASFRIKIMTSIETVTDYYLPQKDGTHVSLSDLNVFHIVVILFNATKRNKVLPSCIAQVLQNRKTRALPTWIYIPENNSLRDTLEYSEEYLPKLLKDYKKIVLKETKTKLIKKENSHD